MRTLLSFALAGLLAGPAIAGNPPPAAAARAAPAPAEAAATRAEIDRLVERIQDLSRTLGPGEQVRIIRMHSGPDGHELSLDNEARVHIEREPGRNGRGVLPKVRFEGRPTVGIGVVLSANPAAPGVRLAAVTPQGPAAKAGLRSGDVLLSVDGRRVEGHGDAAMASAHQLLRGLEKGRRIKLGYARAGKGAEATVIAGEIRRTMLLGGAPGGGGWLPGDAEMRMFDPKIERELRRLMPMIAPCAPGADDCEAPALFEAFRWQGLNLAALDADLGRYFGTRQGVLVLSGGFKGLRSGDVIQKVGDTPVESPREVMRALRTRAVGTALQVLVLRDRKPVVVTITVPEAKALPFMPTAPPPPVPPVPGVAPAPPAPPAPAVPHSRRSSHAAPAPIAPPARPARPAAPTAPAPPDDYDAAML